MAYQGWHGIIASLAKDGITPTDIPCWVMNEDSVRYKVRLGTWTGYVSAWERVTGQAVYTGEIGWVRKEKVSKR